MNYNELYKIPERCYYCKRKYEDLDNPILFGITQYKTLTPIFMPTPIELAKAIDNNKKVEERMLKVKEKYNLYN